MASDLGPDCIPGFMDELLTSKESVEKIAAYCLTVDGTKKKDFDQTSKYISDSLANVAYAVHRLSLHTANYLDQQISSVELLEQKIHCLDMRLEQAKRNRVRINDLCGVAPQEAVLINQDISGFACDDLIADLETEFGVDRSTPARVSSPTISSGTSSLTSSATGSNTNTNANTNSNTNASFPPPPPPDRSTSMPLPPPTFGNVPHANMSPSNFPLPPTGLPPPSF